MRKTIIIIIITVCGVDLGTHDAASFFHSSGIRFKPDLTKLE
jgi:hypothetical protein